MIMATSVPTRFRRAERYVYRCIAGEHLLVDLHSKSANPFYAVTATVAPLWEALADWQSETTLASRLVERYGIPAEQAERDVRTFLDELEAIGGVQRDESR